MRLRALASTLALTLAFPQAGLACGAGELLLYGAPRLNYDFVGYLARRNEGELRNLPVGARYYLEKVYYLGWDVTVDSRLEEHLPFLRVVEAETVERELRHDIQLVIESFRSRRGFNRDRLRWIREAERTLPLHRMLHLKIRTADDLTEEFVRLFDGTVEAGADEAERQDARAPFERRTGYVAPEREESTRTGKVIAVVELGRAYKWGLEEDSPETFVDLLAEIGTYLDQKYLSQGIEAAVYVHTDEAGARFLFPKFGFSIVRTPEQLGHADEYVMRMEGRELVRRHGSRVPLWQALWDAPARRQSAIEIYDAPRDICWRRHPFLRPTIRSRPRLRDTWQRSRRLELYPPDSAVSPWARGLYELRAAFPIQTVLARPQDWETMLLRSRDLGF